MLKAILFDLDNTLIIFDEVTFVRSYFNSVAEKFSDVIPADKFAEKLWRATMEMQNNDGSMINRQRFLNSFSAGISLTQGEIWSRFERFYNEDFDKFKYPVARPDCAHEVFAYIQEKGLRIVIATNPIWPLSAQMRRLSWVGLNDFEIELVTHIDNMTYCKPRLDYYQQICSLIGESPQNCLMVGDDPANDMIAAKIGMRTYLTDDSLRKVEKPLEVSRRVIGDNTDDVPPADFKGPLACVIEAIDNLIK